MSTPVAPENTSDATVTVRARKLPKLPRPNAKKIVTYTLAGVGVVALAKVASSKLHRGEDASVEVDLETTE